MLDAVVIPSLLLPFLWQEHVVKMQILAIYCHCEWPLWHATSFLVFANVVIFKTVLFVLSFLLKYFKCLIFEQFIENFLSIRNIEVLGKESSGLYKKGCSCRLFFYQTI